LLTERPLNSVSQNVTICYGDSLQVGNNFYTSSGLYIDTLTSMHGCDSIVSTDLTELLQIAFTQNLIICFGDSVQVGNIYYYNTGNYLDSLIAKNG